jgi:hypothetical protein
MNTRTLPCEAAGKDQCVIIDFGALAGEIKASAYGVLR